MPQYLYRNKQDGRYNLYPVNDIHKVAIYMEFIGEINELMELNANLKKTNNDLELFLRERLVS